MQNKKCFVQCTPQGQFPRHFRLERKEMTDEQFNIFSLVVNKLEKLEYLSFLSNEAHPFFSYDISAPPPPLPVEWDTRLHSKHADLMEQQYTGAAARKHWDVERYGLMTKSIAAMTNGELRL